MNYVKVEIFIPEERVIALVNALNDHGYLTQGTYDYAFCTSKVIGRWRPLEGSNPYDGEIGVVSQEEETKLEFRLREEDVKEAVKLIRSIHPYETPIINLLPLIAIDE